MKALGKKIENMFVAITFAEAGEFETAQGIPEGGRAAAAVRPNRPDRET